MASSEDIHTLITRLEAEYKKDTARVKINFSHSRSKLITLLEEQERPSRRAVLDACWKMDSCSEIAAEVLTSFSVFYLKLDELQKSMRVSSALEKIHAEYNSARETATDYLKSRIDDRSGYTSNSRSEGMPDNKLQNGTTCEVIRYRQEQQNRDKTAKQDRSSEFDVHAKQFESTCTCTGAGNWEAPTIEQDLWKQLKRVQIPVFNGNKRTYQSWKTAFTACIDNAPATPEFKLLQLRQYVSGEALQAIENLGHSPAAYEAAKERLERKYGGKRRQIAVYLEDLENFKQVRSGHAKDLEKLADLLIIALINLKEAGQDHELGDWSLYTKLHRKSSESMLARYHRWVFENNVTESVTALRQWVVQEAEFQTIAAETIHGLTGKCETPQPIQSFPTDKNPRTFFGETESDCVSEKTCQFCGGRHMIWSCRTFAKKPPSERWNIAKRAQLCYHCLDDGHYGKMCPNSKICGNNGCGETHHILLHRPHHMKGPSVSDTSGGTEPKRVIDSKIEHLSEGDCFSEDVTSSVTEGKGRTREQPTTMVTHKNSQSGYLALRTVPVILKNGDRSLKVNALLDEASTRTYINTGVATKLGLNGRAENISVNVLNGQIEAFEAKSVSFELQNVDRTFNLNVIAYTANRVTGDMHAVNWNEYSSRWPYLKRVNLPIPAKKPTIYILLGLDCLDLHCALGEIRGQPSKPVARLTPLGWTCIGNPYQADIPRLETHFAYTNIIRNREAEPET